MTQIIWKSSTKLGCGYAACNGSPYWSCNFDPGGNMVGAHAQNIDAPISPAPSCAQSGAGSTGATAGGTATTTTTGFPEVGTELSMVMSVDLTSMDTTQKGALGDTLAASLHETSCAPLVPVSFATLVNCYEGIGIGGSSATIEFVIDSALGLSAMPTYPYTRRLSDEELKRLLSEHAAPAAAEGKLFEGDMFFSAVG